MKLEKYMSLMNKYPYLFMDDTALLRIVMDGSVIQHWQENYRQNLIEQNLPLEWAEIGILLEDPYNIIVRDLVQFPDGQMRGYGRSIATASLRGGRGVVVLPRFQEKILLLHQYRHPTRQWHYQIPLGYGEPNTSAEENARKEVEEETGGEISTLISLGQFYANPGYEAVAVSLFYAELSSVGSANLNEGIESFVWVTVKELEDMIANEQIMDSFTIAAYTRAKLRGLI